VDVSDELDIIADHQILERAALKADIARTFKKFVRAHPSSFDVDYDYVIVAIDPIIRFTKLPLVFSNTLYRFHQKSEEEKVSYLKNRYLTLATFQYYLKKSANYYYAAKMTSDFIIDLLDDFNEFDYFVEFLFLPKFRDSQAKLISYLILGLLNREIYGRLQELTNPYDNVPTTINIGNTVINRLRYITKPPDTVRIRKEELIYEIPTVLFPRMEEYETADIQSDRLDSRIVGKFDKEMQTDKIRSYLDNLFPVLNEKARQKLKLTRKYGGENIDTEKNHDIPVKYIKTSISLIFDESPATFIWVYQFLSTFIPLKSETENMSLIRLGSWKHDMDLYNEKIGMKLVPVHQREIVEIEQLGRDITILQLSPKNFLRLKTNLNKIEEYLPQTFKAPRLELNWFGLQFRHDFFIELFEYFYRTTGLESNIISSNYLIRHEAATVSFSMIYGKETGYFQIHGRKEFNIRYRKQLSNLKNIGQTIIRLAVYETIDLINLLDTGEIGERAAEVLNEMVEKYIKEF